LIEARIVFIPLESQRSALPGRIGKVTPLLLLPTGGARDQSLLRDSRCRSCAKAPQQLMGCDYNESRKWERHTCRFRRTYVGAISAGDRLRFTMLQSISATSWLRLVTSSLRKIP